MANSWIQKLRRFQSLTGALSEGRVESLVQWRRGHFGQRLGWFAAIVWKGFVGNRCLTRAAALAYATVLALVPLLAIGLSVSTSVLKDDSAERIEDFIDRLVSTVAPQLSLQEGDDTADRMQLVKAIQDGINKIESGTLGITAFIAFAFIAISLLSTVEGTFNDIWGVRRSRAWLARTIAYWAFLTLGPLLLFAAIGMTGVGEFAKLGKSIEVLSLFRGYIAFGLSFVVLCGICSLCYYLLPNTRVDWKAALLGGAVAGLILQLNNHFSAVYVSRVLTAHRIYGSLSIIPLFLFGLYLSWTIMLFGAQVAASFQKRHTDPQLATRWTGSRARETLALRLITSIGARFHAGQEAPGVSDLATELSLPDSLIHELVSVLGEANLLRATSAPIVYLPARPLESINVHHVLEAMRGSIDAGSASGHPAFDSHLAARLESIALIERKAAENLTILSLVRQLAESPADKFEG